MWSSAQWVKTGIDLPFNSFFCVSNSFCPCRIPKPGWVHSVAISLAVVGFMLPWQFAQFALLTQVRFVIWISTIRAPVFGTWNNAINNFQTSFNRIVINYCKSGNIRGTLIFANFAQNSASAISKTRENICNILYAHFGHLGAVYWPCVLMQMGNILESVWDLLCFCAAQLHTYL